MQLKIFNYECNEINTKNTIFAWKKLEINFRWDDVVVGVRNPNK